MGGMIPLTDASRRPLHFPIVTACIILTNFFVFALELRGGDAFVLKWAAVPANIIAGHHWITILTAMFLHGSWSHILGNMVFLWAFGPEIEDAMNPLRYLAFLPRRRAGGYAGPSRRQPQFHSSQPGRERRNCGCHGRISGDVPSRSDSSLLIIFVFVRVTFIPAALLIGFWFLTQLINAGSVATVQTGGVAYLAHVGGVIFGAATARLFEDPQRLAD